MLAYARRHPRPDRAPPRFTTDSNEPSRQPRRSGGEPPPAYTPARRARFLVFARGARTRGLRAAARRVGAARGGRRARLLLLGRVGRPRVARRGLARGR